MQQIWPWISFASYLGAAVMCLLWLTSGGERHSSVVRWRLALVIVLWPIALAGGLGTWFVEYMFKTSYDE